MANEQLFKDKVVYHSTKEVSEILSVNESTIRFWCTTFKSILNIDNSGFHRKFTENDIKNLKFIKKLLREKGFTTRQVLENYKNIKPNDIKDETNDILLNELVSKFSIELNENLDIIKNEIFDFIKKESQRIIDNQKKNNNELKEIISKTIEETLDKKLGELKIFEQLSIEKHKNKQLENIILELYTIKSTQDIQPNKKKILKNSILDF